MQHFKIPDWCRKNCNFRNPTAKYMPACTYPGCLHFTKDKVCLCYRKRKSVEVDQQQITGDKHESRLAKTRG